MYKVLAAFTDKDNLNKTYQVGETFQSEEKDRIQYLLEQGLIRKMDKKEVEQTQQETQSQAQAQAQEQQKAQQEHARQAQEQAKQAQAQQEAKMTKTNVVRGKNAEKGE